jgi:3-oxoacyl-[acyl-carrier protein] reductase
MISGHPTRIHYVASKSALIGFTRSLARELGPGGITVNMLVPGSTLSEENPTDDVLEMRKVDAVGRSIGRVQRPSDLVGPLVYLASPASDFMSGQLMNVDGGKNMY